MALRGLRQESGFPTIFHIVANKRKRGPNINAMTNAITPLGIPKMRKRIICIIFCCVV